MSDAAGMKPIVGNPGRLAKMREPLPCWSAFTEGHITKDGKLVACCFGANEVVPSYSGGAGIEYGFSDKFAPRLGFAYDVKGDGKWKAYGSFGWFYDVMKLSLPISSFGGDKWIDYYYALDTYDIYAMKCNPANDGLAGNCGPGTLYESYDYRFNSSVPDPRLADYFGGQPTNTIDAKHPYKTDELTFGLDHELTPTISVGARYVRKRLQYAIEDVGVLLPSSPTNPGGIEVYFIANPGFGVTQVLLPDYPDYKTPKPKRWSPHP